MKQTKSAAAFAAARKYIPGGVNSPVRSYRNVDAEPPFIAKASGSRICDIDGNEYIDYVLSWGPMLLGHAHPQVVSALAAQAELGTSYGAPTLAETEIARRLQDFFPALEMVRLVSSGTEATMSALRLARGFTGRDKIVKFIGCYHGHSDGLLVKAGSGAATFGVPDSPGIPAEIAADTLTVPYNDLAALERVFAAEGEHIAAVIIEGVAGNMGLVLPQEGYLPALHELCRRHGALLIVDEVMSGFRASRGGAQEVYGIRPDLICLGKVIGGGLPVGAFGGRREVMEHLAPAGPVYQAGTLSGNPLAVRAGLTTLELLRDPAVFAALAAKTERLCRGLEDAAREAGVPVQVHRIGSMFTVFFSAEPVTDYASAARSDLRAFNVYFMTMLENGIYLAPSQFECGFLSTAHSDADIAATLAAARRAFAAATAVQNEKH
ncbi:MAG: glutamate-1-semialdehyde 2,1-aminomutase [Veillonellaceae bacterium]|nr:glutamate-1-semialdehyde 2,1-aminomutase [Veillonellaceae bacterium]